MQNFQNILIKKIGRFLQKGKRLKILDRVRALYQKGKSKYGHILFYSTVQPLLSPNRTKKSVFFICFFFMRILFFKLCDFLSLFCSNKKCLKCSIKKKAAQGKLFPIFAHQNHTNTSNFYNKNFYNNNVNRI